MAGRTKAVEGRDREALVTARLLKKAEELRGSAEDQFAAGHYSHAEAKFRHAAKAFEVLEPESDDADACYSRAADCAVQEATQELDRYYRGTAGSAAEQRTVLSRIGLLYERASDMYEKSSMDPEKSSRGTLSRGRANVLARLFILELQLSTRPMDAKGDAWGPSEAMQQLAEFLARKECGQLREKVFSTVAAALSDDIADRQELARTLGDACKADEAKIASVCSGEYLSYMLREGK